MNLTLQTNPSRAASRRVRAAIGALSLTLVAGWAALHALAGETMMGGGGGTGGDSIGSLPQALTASGGTGPAFTDGEATFGPAAPAFSLVGAESDILAAIVDAFPTGVGGSYAVIPVEGGRVRYEFYNRVTLLLDLDRLMTTPVMSQIRIGATFQGAAATLAVGGQVRATQALPIGALPLPLQNLAAAGVLNQGLLWHAVNNAHQHRILELKQLGGVLRIEQRD